MKTDFEMFRKWRRWQKAIGCVLTGLFVVYLSLSLGYVLRPSHGFVDFQRISHHSLVGFIFFLSLSLMNVISLCVMDECLHCPHCGKLVMSKWLGRDAAGRNCAKRIQNRQPIQCIHCGQEIDTN